MKGAAKTWFCICKACGKTGNFDPDYIRSRGLCEPCGGELVWHAVYEGKFRSLLDEEIAQFKKRLSQRKGGVTKKAAKKAARKSSWREWWEPKHPCPWCREVGVRIFLHKPLNNGVRCDCGECGKYVKFLPHGVVKQYVGEDELLNGEPVEVFCVGEAAQ